MTKSLATIHPLQTDGRTDDRLMTTMPTARPLLKYGRLKSLNPWVSLCFKVLQKHNFYGFQVTRMK